MTLPLVALMPLIARRLTPEVLWLAVAALLFAYFVNTDNPPFGGIYDWMYSHVPGWNLFREGSKFLFVVGMAYAILIPIALKMAFEWAATRTSSLSRYLIRSLAATAAFGVVVISAFTVGVLQSGALGLVHEPDRRASIVQHTVSNAWSRRAPRFPVVVRGTCDHRGTAAPYLRHRLADAS